MKKNTYVLCFDDIDRTKFMLAGGKGANLGELSRIEGIRVPEGFCVITEAYKRITGDSEEFNNLLEELARVRIEERANIGSICAKIRSVIKGTPIPTEMAEEIAGHLLEYGADTPFAVRSSATAEDLATASFAGQQDSYLNVIGKEGILRHISQCWASLFTDRAVIYRMQNGFDHRKVYLSVVVQKMVLSQVSGVMFTADPVTSNRKVVSIDAGPGLGEELVAGLVNTDVYKVCAGRVVDKRMPATPALTDEQILELERVGRKIEKYFGSPQDIEWCLIDDLFYIVQSRPITTLYPIPEANDQENHVYISVGHQQMMTDAMKPLGLSFFELTAFLPRYKAGGRLFVDVASDLASPDRRDMLVNMLGKSDPLIRDALVTILERGDFIKAVPGSDKAKRTTDFRTLKDYDPVIVHELIGQSETAIEELKRKVRTKSGSDLMDYILEDIKQLRKSLSDTQCFGVIMTAMNAASWLNEKMQEWLGDKSVADILSQSLSNNVTSEMGLALLDVADVIRPHPEVINYLQHVKEDRFLDGLIRFEGGVKVRDAIHAFLDKYGMRCAGEIDITRPRWSEKPAILIPMILGNIRKFEPGASFRKFEQGREEALNKEQELLLRLKELPDGEQKATETKRMIDLVRNLAGYREYPKYSIVSRYLLYKEALLEEAERLVQTGAIYEKEDIYYLSFEELSEVIRIRSLDRALIRQRKDEFRAYEKLRPPRVITSDGEIITGRYNRENIPAEAIAGLAVSSGTIEGRARVILNMEDADLEDGDILVTAFTDPSWTPLFLSIKGLVTEVGGLMTHGAVIAREYGLPAVVGVENATRLIKDGQMIRVNGTDGYIEVIPNGKNHFMQKISPFIWFDNNAEEAMNFYLSVFKNSKVVRVARTPPGGPGPEGSFLVASIELEGDEIILMNGGPGHPLTDAISLTINCNSQEEVDYYWDKLIEGGGKPIACGWLQDRYGLFWQVTPVMMGQLLSDPDRAKAGRAMQAMMKMIKLDINALKAAAEGK